ncbi:MAG: type II secretion system protein GspM [Planctomycetota bacterium]
MSETPRPPTLSEDDRFALAARADATERTNRPRWLIGVAGVLLAIAMAYLLFAFGARGAAENSRRQAASQVRTIKGLLQQIEALESAEPSANAAVPIGERLPDLLSRMESIARRAGLTDALPIPRETPSENGALRSVKYEYTMRDPRIAPLLRFVEYAQADVPALRVQSILIKPNRDRWEMTVAFLRWDRGA